LIWGPQLKRRTPQGRRILDQIAGFPALSRKGRKDRLERLNSAGETPEMLDEHLPYAIALEVRERGAIIGADLPDRGRDALRNPLWFGKNS